MKTTFTLCFLVVFMASSLAENPFKKEKHHRLKHKAINTLKATAVADDPMSMTTYEWSGTDWINASVYTFTYNAQGLLETRFNDFSKMTYAYYVSGQVQSITTQFWDGSIWNNSNEQRYNYDSEGNESESTSYDWNGSTWELQYGNRTVNEYDNGEIISQIGSYYNSSSMTWEEEWGWKDEFVRDEQNRLIEENYYERIGGAWVLQDYFHYFYDGQGRVDYSLEGDSESSVVMKFIYFYDAQNVLIEATVYEIDGETETLVGRYTSVVWAIWNEDGFTDDSYLLEALLQMWDGSDFVNGEKIDGDLHGYSGTGTPPIYTETTSEWNGSSYDPVYRETRYDGDYNNYTDEQYINGSWYITYENRNTSTIIRNYYATYDDSGNIISGYHDESTFDAYGAEIENFSKSNNGSGWVQTYGNKTIIIYESATPKVLEKIYQNWDGSTYVNYMREVYNYTPTNLDLLAKEGIKIYPTAFKHNIAVQSALSGKIFIYNISGAKVLEKPIFNGINSINTSHFENGLYIVKVKTKDGETIRKVVKQ
nr:T9SS type A sorting domain-containing protein [uncultured Carboxylicivirga sp.]